MVVVAEEEERRTVVPFKANLGLSKREVQVLDSLFLFGHRKMVARQLGITHATVKNHLLKIYRKLQVSDGCGSDLRAIREALAQGYIQPPSTKARRAYPSDSSPASRTGTPPSGT